METPEEKYFEMATANTKLTRPVVCVDECLALMRDFAAQQVKLFAISNVSNTERTVCKKCDRKLLCLECSTLTERIIEIAKD